MTPTEPDVLVGVDLGTSGLKAVARSLSGDVVASAGATYPTARPEPTASEQDPAAWLDALRSSLDDLADDTPRSRWLGLGLSAMIPTLVTVDRDGAPVGPAITWEDGRAEDDGLALRDLHGADRLYAETGQWVDGRYLLPMALRLATEDPGRLARTAQILGAKDYLFQVLTGTAATDPSTATGFGCYGLGEGAWLPGVVASASRLLRQELPALPPIRPSMHAAPATDHAGRSLGLPAGLPVVLGSADSVSAVLSLGLGLGDVAYIAGTSTVILGVVDEPVPDHAHRYLVTPLAVPGRWGVEMDLLATGSAVRWLAGLLGMSERELMALAEERPLRADAADDSPVFLPYLAPGEQGALWDPALTGTLTGLALQHDRADLARALVTGIVLESRRCIRIVSEVAGRAGRILVAGSSGSSPGFRRDLADATGLCVESSGPSSEHSAIGAALVAGRALGAVTDDLDAGPRGWATVRPDESAAAVWQRCATHHDAALAAVRRLVG